MRHLEVQLNDSRLTGIRLYVLMLRVHLCGLVSLLITAKAHRRANSILRCFVSGNTKSL